MAKCNWLATEEQQKLPSLLSKAMDKQFTRFICITYQGKQNGSVVSTNNQCTEWLQRTQILPMAKCMGSTANIT